MMYQPPSPLAAPGCSADARPMLARDADSMFWMSRYVERSEHVARLLRVHAALLTDVGDLTPELEAMMWNTIMITFRSGDLPAGDGPLGPRIARHMTFDLNTPNSISSCIARARENARAIRESISSEMWECMNAIYWSVQAEDAPARYEDSPDDYFYGIMTSSMLFQGLSNQTMAHDQRWAFTHVARYLERIDVTARVIETRFEVLSRMEAELDQPLNIHLMGVLRSCCSLETYRRMHLADLDADRVAQFLILQRDFPRSIRFCVEEARHALEQVRESNGSRTPSNPERILGRLSSQLEYTDINEVLAGGLGAFLQQIQSTVAEASLSLQKTYFLY
ncbi:MAG TPA: alpha-E domain-containing protein [Tepidisphaeraceae bacterium]